MTHKMFWNMILHTRNDKEGYHSYMLKYWPSMKLVFIKPVRTGGQHTEAQKRKHAQLEPEQAAKGKGKAQAWGFKGADQYQRGTHGTSSGWQDHAWGRSPAKNQWRSNGGWVDAEEEERPEEWAAAPTYDTEGKMVAVKPQWS
eukprot:5165169-Heterocapsa_arctica.AAC.1